jgi:hypothetical protein
MIDYQDPDHPVRIMASLLDLLAAQEELAIEIGKCHRMPNRLVMENMGST